MIKKGDCFTEGTQDFFGVGTSRAKPGFDTKK